jgi:hypothetical protein
MSRTCIVASVMAILGTAAAAQDVPAAPDLAQFDRRAVEYFKETLRDPLSAIIERYGTPSRGRFNSGLFKSSERQGYWQCYRVNAKNGYGGYSGARVYALHFQDNDGLIGVAAVEFSFDEAGRHCTGNAVAPVLSPALPGAPNAGR